MNSSSSGEIGGGMYDLGLSPGWMLLLNAADGGTNNTLSVEMEDGIGGAG